MTDTSLSYVYFFRLGDRVKIGTSSALLNRFMQLRAEFGPSLECVGAMFGGYDIERAVHREFAAFRIEHEWFHWEPISSAAIHSIIERRGFQGNVALEEDGALPPVANIDDEEKRLVSECISIVGASVQKRVSAGTHSTRDALVSVCRAARLPEGPVWALRYRPPSTVSAGVYNALKRLVDSDSRMLTLVEADQSEGEH